jgi:hypothetical protein
MTSPFDPDYQAQIKPLHKLATADRANRLARQRINHGSGFDRFPAKFGRAKNEARKGFEVAALGRAVPNGVESDGTCRAEVKL